MTRLRGLWAKASIVAEPPTADRSCRSHPEAKHNAKEPSGTHGAPLCTPPARAMNPLVRRDQKHPAHLVPQRRDALEEVHQVLVQPGVHDLVGATVMQPCMQLAGL